VPKTGGTTLAHFLGSLYSFRQKVKLIPPRLAKLRLSELPNYRFYHAMHQGRQMLALTGRCDLLCVTMLRDPIEWAVSHILYFQRLAREQPGHFLPEYLEATRPLLKADLTEPVDEIAFGLACKSQTRTLGILEDYRPLFRGGPDVASGRSIIRPYPLPPLMDVHDQDALLANALAWLETFQVVGITEHYGRSLELVCDALGVAVPTAVPQVNANPGRPAGKSDYARRIAPRLRDQLAALTAADQELYAAGLERFEAQWSRYQAQPKRLYSIGSRMRTALWHQETFVKARGALRPIKQAIQRRFEGTV
jgi:hypothetical protein